MRSAASVFGPWVSTRRSAYPGLCRSCFDSASESGDEWIAHIRDDQPPTSASPGPHGLGRLVRRVAHASGDQTNALAHFLADRSGVVDHARPRSAPRLPATLAMSLSVVTVPSAWVRAAWRLDFADPGLGRPTTRRHSTHLPSNPAVGWTAHCTLSLDFLALISSNHRPNQQQCYSIRPQRHPRLGKQVLSRTVGNSEPGEA